MEKKKQMNQAGDLHRSGAFFATFFYIGLLPVMPGTFGSLAGLAFFLILRFIFPSGLFLFIMAVLLFLLGMWSSEKVLEKSDSKDPSYVVIDEVAGVFVALLFVSQVSFVSCLTVFILFRIFDILKIFPVNVCEDLPGGWGIMADDIAAGLLAGGIFRIVLFLF